VSRRLLRDQPSTQRGAEVEDCRRRSWRAKSCARMEEDEGGEDAVPAEESAARAGPAPKAAPDAHARGAWRRRHRWARRLVLVLVGYARGQHVKRRSSRPLLLLWPGVAFTYLSPWLGAGYVLGRVVAPLGPEDWDHQIDRLRKDLDKLEDAWRRATRRASQAR